MKIRPFTIPAGLDQKFIPAAEKLNRLIAAANQHDLPQGLVQAFNQKLTNLEQKLPNPETKVSSISKLTAELIDSLRADAKLFTKNYFLNFWMSLGMAVFGIPFGVAFSAVLKNFAFVGIGLPIGFSIGIGIGTAKDNQVKKEGRQLDF